MSRLLDKRPLHLPPRAEREGGEWPWLVYGFRTKRRARPTLHLYWVGWQERGVERVEYLPTLHSTREGGRLAYLWLPDYGIGERVGVRLPSGALAPAGGVFVMKYRVSDPAVPNPMMIERIARSIAKLEVFT